MFYEERREERNTEESNYSEGKKYVKKVCKKNIRNYPISILFLQCLERDFVRANNEHKMYIFLVFTVGLINIFDKKRGVLRVVFIFGVPVYTWG